MMRLKMWLSCLLVFVGNPFHVWADGRIEQDLSGPRWRLWRDEQAQWKNDELLLPGTDLARIPISNRERPVSWRCEWHRVI
jgi:hypothetical protein